jgi:hypothetical protein
MAGSAAGPFYPSTTFYRVTNNCGVDIEILEVNLPRVPHVRTEPLELNSDFGLIGVQDCKHPDNHRVLTPDEFCQMNVAFAPTQAGPIGESLIVFGVHQATQTQIDAPAVLTGTGV